jgi:signal recognition particle GTPase
MLESTEKLHAVDGAMVGWRRFPTAEKFMRAFTVPTVVLTLAVALAGCDSIGGGDIVVKGHDNVVVARGAVDRVAVELADFESTPRVTDEDIQALYEQIREAALAGDMDAMLVMLKVATIQRRPVEPEE